MIQGVPVQALVQHLNLACNKTFISLFLISLVIQLYDHLITLVLVNWSQVHSNCTFVHASPLTFSYRSMRHDWEATCRFCTLLLQVKHTFDYKISLKRKPEVLGNILNFPAVSYHAVMFVAVLWMFFFFSRNEHGLILFAPLLSKS